MARKVHPSIVSFVFRPINQWSGPERCKGKNNPFRVTPGRTQSDLRIELGIIGVPQCVIQADLADDDIRLDGMPRANASFRSTKAAISFEHPEQGALSFPCWTYQNFWANIRAIVMTLQALRAVDRHGVTKNAQQFTGWKQLPPQGTAIVAAAFASAEEAARFIIQSAEWAEDSDGSAANAVLNDPAFFTRAYRAAAQKVHPDTGGSVEMMSRLNAARDLIRLATKGAA